MVKEHIWPQRGTGGGCKAPWDMEEIIGNAVKSQQGRIEFAWHCGKIVIGRRFTLDTLNATLLAMERVSLLGVRA